MSKKADIFRDQTAQELEVLLKEKSHAYFELRNRLEREKKVDNRGDFIGLKKDIARIHTILREKELAS